MNPPTVINLDLFNIIALINRVFTSCSQWFTKVIDPWADIYFFGILIALGIRFFVSPVVGAATFTAASDRVRAGKEKSRHKGKFERNQKGRYSK